MISSSDCPRLAVVQNGVRMGDAYLALLDVELIADIFVGFPVVNLFTLAEMIILMKETKIP